MKNPTETVRLIARLVNEGKETDARRWLMQAGGPQANETVSAVMEGQKAELLRLRTLTGELNAQLVAAREATQRTCAKLTGQYLGHLETERIRSEEADELNTEIERLRADLSARDRTIEIERNARVAACAHAEEEKQRAETAEAALAARDEIIRNMERGARQGAVESREYIARLEKDVEQLREGLAARDATIAELEAEIVTAQGYGDMWMKEKARADAAREEGGK